MGNVDYTLKMTPSQKRFFEMVDAFGIIHLWNIEKREYYPDAVEKYLGIASHSEAILTRFCLGVWLHKNDYHFDFIDAASVLDREHIATITNWMREPFWP